MIRSKFVTFVLATHLLSAAVGQQLNAVPPRYGHLLYLPKKTWAAKKKWPLVLYLHGRSLSGNDLNALMRYGLPKRLRNDKSFPFIAVCPQLPSGQRWTDTRALARLVNEIARSYPVDRSRIYAVGFSMGASGVWRAAHDNPRMFAAIVSIGGIYEQPLAMSGKLKNVPIWSIHGTADIDAPFEDAKMAFELHQESGGMGKFTALPGKDHNISEFSERGPVYHWLLEHRLPR